MALPSDSIMAPICNLHIDAELYIAVMDMCFIHVEPRLLR